MIDSIIGTDMSRHVDHVTKLHDRADRDTVFKRESVSDRIDLCKHIVHCSDLAGQTLPAKISEEFGRRVLEEFTAQTVAEKAVGLEPTSFMTGLDEDRKRCELQLNFVASIVLPLWRGMARCFPKCQERVDRAEEVREDYERRLEEHKGLEKDKITENKTKPLTRISTKRY